MSIRAATPYLILAGQAEQAIALYQRALGAKVEMLKRFGDVDQSCPAAQRDQIMHASLRVDGALLMLSDGGEGPAPTPGGIVSVALDLDDREQARRCFDALAAGGTIVQPLFDSPWGTLFGVVVDPFGVNWMLDCGAKTS